MQTYIFNETKTTKTITKTKTTTKTIAKTKKKDKDIDIKILQVNLLHRFHQLSVVHFEWEKDNRKDNYKDKDINIESLQAYLSRKFHQLSSGSSWCRLTFWMRPQFSERRVFEIWYLENINYQPKFLEHEICRLLFWESRAKQYKYEIFRILFLESQASYKTVSAGYCFENRQQFPKLKIWKILFWKSQAMYRTQHEHRRLLKFTVSISGYIWNMLNVKQRISRKINLWTTLI